MFKKFVVLSAMVLVALQSHADNFLKESGFKGGIIVHLNCGDGSKTVELAEGNNCLVHGLDMDAANITEARESIHAKGLYGRVSVAQYDGKTLPYVDNLVNLVVDQSGKWQVASEEIERVLAPGGKVLGNSKLEIGNSTLRQSPAKNGWNVYVKPVPPEIDDWPQYLNKADNNAVAMDSVVGPPRRIQWVDEPLWSRSHMGIATIASVVTAGGRMFTIEDRALPDHPFLPGRFTYVARDAFNGQTLWEQKIDRWESIETYIKCLPTQQQRRMVATDKILFCTPTLEGPLAALDAATGKILKTYDALSPVQEVAYDQGILFVNVGERFNAGAYNQTNKKAPKEMLGTPGEPFAGAGFSKGYAARVRDKENPSSFIAAIDPESGKTLWKTAMLNKYTGASLSVKGANAVYQTSEGLFCVDPKTGKERWSVKKQIGNKVGHDSRTPGTQPNTVMIGGDMVFAVEGKELYGYSLKDGTELWNTRAVGNYQASVDLFYVNGILWTGAKFGATGLDPKTGKVVKTIKQKVTGPMSHDRCYRNYITERFFINSKTGGADFLNLEDGREYPNHWTRGTCGMGVIPANGLVYSSPYSCTCSVGDMMKGMNAYSADPELLESNDSALIKRVVRLEKGPAYSSINHQPSTINHSSSWPTYRGNNFRGGVTKSAVSSELKVKWQSKLPGNPTASTVADGKVFVSVPEKHTLYALDSASGKTLWTFTADGRIDSPPTYYKGMVLFGSRDGWLYCLKAADGELAWRFKDLPGRLVGAFGQLESAWPISGSVLVLDDNVYASAGRSSFLDGGIFLYCLDPATGELLNSRSNFGPFAAETGFPVGFRKTEGFTKGGKVKKKRKLKEWEKASGGKLPGLKNDLLVSDGSNIFMRHAMFDKELQRKPSEGLRLMPLGGFLDRRAQHRMGYILRDHYEWWRNDPKDIMIVDGKETFAVSGFRSWHNHAYFDPRTSAYKLSGPDIDVALPINGRALAKAGDVIFVAGEQMKFKDPTWQNYEAAYTGKKGGKLLAVKDGKIAAEYKLSSPVNWDSIALAGGNLYICLTDGTVQCMEEQRK